MPKRNGLVLCLLALVVGLVVVASFLPENVRADRDHDGVTGTMTGRFSSTLPPNPAIQALLDDVSVDSLFAYVQTMEDFGTRHTNSDTTSPTRGIGAARNWVLSHFQQSAAGAVGAAEASFFVFDTTACGIHRTHKNVMLTQTGTASPDRHFVVSGHLDSRMESNCDATSDAPGANDDASGVALVMEMARILTGLDLDATMLYMAVTGEEQDLLGARKFTEYAVANGLRIDGMITNDIVGNIEGCADPSCPKGEPVIVDSTSIRHFSQDPSFGIHRQLTRQMKLTAMRYESDISDHGFTVNLIPRRDRVGRGGDHFPFGNAGYAAARFTEPNEFGDGSGANGHQHNGTDFIEFMNFNYLARVVRLNLAGYANLALAPETPASVEVFNEGMGDLLVRWPSVTSVGDVAGYRVAVRSTHPDSLFYSDVLDAGLDTGATQEYTLSGLPEGVAVLVSVSAYDIDFNESRFTAEVEATPIVAVGDPGGVLGDGLLNGVSLYSMSANPGSDVTRIGFAVPAAGELTIDVLDVGGRRVARLAEGPHGGGAGAVFWDGRGSGGRGAGSGVYFVRMMVDGQAAGTIKVTRVR